MESIHWTERRLNEDVLIIAEENKRFINRAVANSGSRETEFRLYSQIRPLFWLRPNSGRICDAYTREFSLGIKFRSTVSS